MSSELNLITET